ncbi:hypothetical protein P4V58_01225 [Bacillus wiedmannii]|uniref:hypothetical protein n=1 Tax=Bacillus wiedmannii TaxID=1890302 RepID=UPI002E1DB513|nr:hypothetical protein [Bacillus wiedmannii]
MNFVHSLVKISKVSGYAFLTAWLGVQLLGPDGFAEIINGTVNEKGRDYFNLLIPHYILVTTFFLALLECISNILPDR